MTQALHHITKQDDKLFIYSMNKRLRITAIFTDDESANKHMEKTDDAVVACFGPFVFLANKYDHGTRE